MKEIEIIFVDDNSSDNSSLIIEAEMKLDKRIKLFKNQRNMGNLYTKSIGAKKKLVNIFYHLILMIYYF